ERRRFLLVEWRQALPLASGLLQIHATADDLRNGEARAQIVEERSWKAHGDSGLVSRPYPISRRDGGRLAPGALSRLFTGPGGEETTPDSASSSPRRSPCRNRACRHSAPL